jgi:two-component system CheB/CheR fusion protein
MITRDDFGLAAVISELARLGAAGFEWYKESCLLRRIEVRMRARGVPTLLSYATLLAEDPDEVERLLHTLSVRVTGFFRNPESWRALQARLTLDRLGGEGSLVAWSMGCATGEEAWSLAMLLVDHARKAGTPPINRVRVFASDVDSQALATAVAGSYPREAAAAIRELLPDLDGSLRDARFVVDPKLRARVSFRREDLTAAAATPGPCDLVCCRNVLIFLGREGQRRVLDAAFRALRPGGLLMLGRTESLVALPNAPLLPVEITHRIYRRAA